MSAAISASDIAWSARGDITPAAFRFAIAFSTFVQAADCVRMAPTQISKSESPGHQPCGP